MVWLRYWFLPAFFILHPSTFVLSAEGPVYRFSLGSAKAELRPGFTRITARAVYDQQTGYGWRTAQGLKEHYQPYAREWKYDDGRGTAEPPPIYANEITCAGISASRPNAFLLDLRPGEYTVYLLCGRGSGSRYEYHDFDVSVGGARATVKIPGPYRFEKCVLKTTLADRQLAIELLPKSDWVLSAIIVYPTAAEARVRGEFLDALEKEIYFLPPDVAAKWHETKHVDNRPLPQFSGADRGRGYAIFARHWSEIIYPNTVPRGEELDPQLSIFAAPGQYEPATFTVFPFRDFAAASVVASELRSAEAVIPAANVDIRYVRYHWVRPNYSTFFQYHVAPDALEHKAAVEIRGGENQRVWVTVKVPDDARPGVYRGRLTFGPQGAPGASIPLSLRVLPIRLQKNPEHIYGMYYYDPLANSRPGNTPTANAYFSRKAELERQDMAEHGMNSHILAIRGLDRDKQGHWRLNGDEMERAIDLDRKYGLAGKPMAAEFPVSWYYEVLVDKRGMGNHMRLVSANVPQSFFDEVTKMVEAIEKERKNRGWPEFIYYPIDEPSTHEAAIRFMTNVMKAIRRVPGVRTYVTADPSHDAFAPLWPYVDVWCCQPFVFNYDTIKRLSREKHIEFWCYPNHISGENDHTPVKGARMTWGFGFWRSGFKTLIPWIYQADVGDPWNYLDGSSMDFGVRSTPEGEPVPVALWEAFRAGIDDGRYLYTLEQLVAEGKRKGGRAAELAGAGERELKYVWDAIAVQEKYQYDGLWNGPDFDAYRWLLAAKITEIQEALK
jgi:hypothetical protein